MVAFFMQYIYVIIAFTAFAALSNKKSTCQVILGISGVPIGVPFGILGVPLLKSELYANCLTLKSIGHESTKINYSLCTSQS